MSALASTAVFVSTRRLQGSSLPCNNTGGVPPRPPPQVKQMQRSIQALVSAAQREYAGGGGHQPPAIARAVEQCALLVGGARRRGRGESCWLHAAPVTLCRPAGALPPTSLVRCASCCLLCQQRVPAGSAHAAAGLGPLARQAHALPLTTQHLASCPSACSVSCCWPYPSPAQTQTSCCASSPPPPKRRRAPGSERRWVGRVCVVVCCGVCVWGGGNWVAAVCTTSASSQACS